MRKVDVPCGATGAFGDPCVIPAKDPIAEFHGGRVVRCQYHAALMGYEFDPAARQEVELERARLEADEAYQRRVHAAREAEAQEQRSRRLPLPERRDRSRLVVGAGATRGPDRAPAIRPTDQLRLPTGDRDHD